MATDEFYYHVYNTTNTSGAIQHFDWSIDGNPPPVETRWCWPTTADNSSVLLQEIENLKLQVKDLTEKMDFILENFLLHNGVLSEK